MLNYFFVDKESSKTLTIQIRESMIIIIRNVVVSNLFIWDLIKIDLSRCQYSSIAVLIWIITITSTIKAQGVPAIPADLFVESIGVNTHWAYRNVYRVAKNVLPGGYSSNSKWYQYWILYQMKARGKWDLGV